MTVDHAKAGRLPTSEIDYKFDQRYVAQRATRSTPSADHDPKINKLLSQLPNLKGRNAVRDHGKEIKNVSIRASDPVFALNTEE